jgi:hypothetical protein
MSEHALSSPSLCIFPPIPDEFVALCIGADRFRMELNTPEWLLDMLHAHKNGTVELTVKVPS